MSSYAGVSLLLNEQMQEINTESETDGILEWSLSDFHNDGAGGQGVDYTKVKFDW